MGADGNRAERSWIDVGTTASGAPLRLALHTVTGKPGPTAAIFGTVHGDEPITAEVVRRVIGELRAIDLTGTVLAMPVLDPLGFESCTRNTWVDMANLNRCFPGNRGGSVTEQIADAITQTVLNRSDALVDLHSGSWQFCVDYSFCHPGQDDFVNAFGSLATIHRPPIAGSSVGLMVGRGKPAVLAEFGGGLFEDERFVRKGVTGTLNCLKFLGMLPGKPVLERPPIVVDREHWFRPRHGGLLVAEITGHDLGQVIPRGTLLARIISPYTFETLEELRAPFARNLVVCVGSGMTRTQPGGHTYMVVELE